MLSDLRPVVRVDTALHRQPPGHLYQGPDRALAAAIAPHPPTSPRRAAQQPPRSSLTASADCCEGSGVGKKPLLVPCHRPEEGCSPVGSSSVAGAVLSAATSSSASTATAAGVSSVAAAPEAADMRPSHSNTSHAESRRIGISPVLLACRYRVNLEVDELSIDHRVEHFQFSCM